MRILFCNYEYPPLGGGAGVTNAMLAKEMAKRHEVTVLTSQGLGLASQAVEDGVKIIRVPVFFRRKEAVANMPSMFMYLPMGIRAGKELLRDTRYDVINTHFVLPTGPVGDALSRFAGIPNVLLIHGGDLYDPSKFSSPHRHPLLRVWIRRLLRRADVVLGQSRNTLENMRRIYTPEIEGVWIPAMIERPRVGACSRSQYGLKDDEVLLVTVGRLIARKATAQLVAMMAQLKDEKVRLLIIGSGPQEQHLKAESRERQLGDRVLFMGRVSESEKLGILQMCDVYVSTSQHEGFGLVFLEAMACGLPVVCYDHGGQTDFLEDSVTGHVVSLNDLTGFTERCRAMIRDSERRRQISQYNLQRVEDYFVDRRVKAYEAVFEECSIRRRLQSNAASTNAVSGQGGT